MLYNVIAANKQKQDDLDSCTIVCVKYTSIHVIVIYTTPTGEQIMFST